MMPCRGYRAGFSLIELLVVVGIILILLSITLPAVEYSRESARATVCRNHIRQLSLAMIAHEVAHKHFPTGGWGGAWVGDSQRGFGERQPGGWLFNALPHMEQDDLYAMDRGQMTASEYAEALSRRLGVTLPIFHCPSRRSAKLYPLIQSKTDRTRRSLPLEKAAKIDYAANAGDQPDCEVKHFEGPDSLEHGDSRRFRWPNMREATGVSYLRSQVKARNVLDGLSNVYLIAEKSLYRADYQTGADHGDDWSAYTGYQDDIYRSTSINWPPHRDASSTARPYTQNCTFGSPHPGAWNAAFCDGSVRSMDFDIDLEVNRGLGNRFDGQHVGSF